MTTSSYSISSRLFYAGLWCCALPLYVLYLAYRSIRQPEYRKNLQERFGIYRKSAHAPVWLHASSLGEVKAAAPLLAELRISNPDAAVLISCQTPAGRNAALALPIENSMVVYLPFDMTVFTERFIRSFKPRIALIFETEIWPNLFNSAKQAGVPLMIINARITERSVRRYKRFGSLVAQALQLPEQISCQTQADAERYIEAGANPGAVSVSGNVKWDVGFVQDVDNAPRYLGNPVWVAASTHEDEERIVLKIHQKILQRWPEALLVLAPRHPERFMQVYQLADNMQMRVQRRSQQALPDLNCQVFIIDTLGELVRFLPGAKAVFVGGSLQNVGGHNVLEPASLGLPVIVGPHTQHFAEIVGKLKHADALIQVPDALQLQESLIDLLNNPERAGRMGNNGLACIAQSRGALQKTKALINQRLWT